MSYGRGTTIDPTAVDEFELIRRFFVRAGEDGGEGVVLGIGDDGAVLSPPAGRLLVSVVDTLVEGVHWPAELPPADVGFRAVAVNVSDIAAMGGRPRWMTLALTLATVDETWLGAFAAGLFEAADRYGTALVGGDITRGGQTVVSVQITGDVDRQDILKRSGARPGEGIYVTGTPGDAAAGLALIKDRGQAREDHNERDYLVARFSRPQVHVGFAGAMARSAGAAIDLSDGLFADTRKLLNASGVGGRIELSSLPVSPELARAFPEAERLRFALSGGDDYELCFTASASNEKSILQAAEEHDVRVTQIGTVLEGTGLVCTKGGEVFDFADRGYRHFR